MDQRQKEIPLFLQAIFSKENSIIVMPNDEEARACFFRLAQFMDSMEFQIILQNRGYTSFNAAADKTTLRIQLARTFIEIKSDAAMFKQMAAPVQQIINDTIGSKYPWLKNYPLSTRL